MTILGLKLYKDSRRFTGTINFYRAHLSHAALYQAVFSKYLGSTKKKDQTKINWSQEAIEVFENCKPGLKQAGTLAHPRVDSNVALMTDASASCEKPFYRN